MLDTALLENVDGLGSLLENPANEHVLDGMQSAKVTELVEGVEGVDKAMLPALRQQLAEMKGIRISAAS